MAGRRKPVGGKAPKTWQKTRRLTPIERFKMYNPLHMKFQLGAAGTQKKSENVSFSMKRRYQQEMQKMQVAKLKQEKKEMTKSIEKAIFEKSGHLNVSGAEKRHEIGQSEISNSIDLNSNKKMFSLNLEDYGSYKIDYTRNGQYLLLGGSNGHIGLLRWENFRLISEEYFNNDYIYDVKFCMNESLFAVAQRECVYIYNSKCVETHVLRRSMPFKLVLDYLPYHFLLTGIGMQGRLVYFDISIGKKITTIDTKLGICDIMCSNNKNGIIHCGHKNGVVTLWTPTNTKYVASILCHKSKITGCAVNNNGNLMCTSDENGYLKIWDLRKFTENNSLHKYKSNTPIKYCTFSQNNNLLAFSTGRSIVVWNDLNHFHQNTNNTNPHTKKNKNKNNKNKQKNKNKKKQKTEDLELSEHRFNEKIYLQHQMERERGNDLQFCPYQDVLGVGTTKGFTSLIVPGSGQANYDIFENDPFETRKKRNNKVVYQLLDKLRPDMIQLNENFISNLQTKSIQREKRDLDIKHEEMKFARKNITSTKKTGYRGVLRKRYAKYQHMKDLHHRQEKLKKILNIQKKLDSSESKSKQKARQTKMINRITGNKKQQSPALSRFNKKLDGNTRKQQRFNSKWKRNAKKIYF